VEVPPADHDRDQHLCKHDGSGDNDHESSLPLSDRLPKPQAHANGRRCNAEPDQLGHSWHRYDYPQPRLARQDELQS
jgi:hypothetical protein